MSHHEAVVFELLGKGLGWVYDRGRNLYWSYRVRQRFAKAEANAQRQAEAELANPLLRDARLAREARESEARLAREKCELEERKARKAALAREAEARRARQAAHAKQADIERQQREAERLEVQRARLARFIDEMGQGDPDPLIIMDTNVWIDHESSVRLMVDALVASGRRLKVYGEQEREMDNMRKRRSDSSDPDKQAKAHEKASKATRARRLMDELSKQGGLELVRARTSHRIFDDFVDHLAEVAQRESRTFLVVSDDRELRMRVHSRGPVGGSKRIRALEGHEFASLVRSVAF